MPIRTSLTALAVFLLGTSTAAAQEAVDPYRSWPGITTEHEVGPGPAPAPGSEGLSFSGEGDTFLQTEATKPDNTTTKGTVFNETNLYGQLNWSDWLTLNGALKYEHQRFNNIEDFYPDRSSFMRSEGLTLRQLYLALRPEGDSDITLYGGKIHPHFGTAWSYNANIGLFYNFGTDYEQDEMIGFGADMKIPETDATSWLGDAHVSAETFFLDTTILSNSLFGHPAASDIFVDRPGHFTLADGGAANTNDLDSVTVALQGHDVFGAKGAAYQLSYTHEGVRQPGEKPQTGFSAAGSYGLNITEDVVTTPYSEYAWIDNFNGQAGLRRNYAILGLATTYEKWELDLAGGLRGSRDFVAGTNLWDTQENISLTYEVIEKLRLGGGFNHIDVDHVGSNTLGLTASYEFSM